MAPRRVVGRAPSLQKFAKFAKFAAPQPVP
jgi:hypothetical protein